MSRPHLIARLILATMGIYLLMRSLGWIGSVFLRLNIQCHPEGYISSMYIGVITGILAFATSVVLLFWSGGLAKMISGQDASQCEKVDGRWIIAGFRMTACLCGLLIIYHRIENLLYYVPAIMKSSILSYLTLEGQTSQFSSKTAAGILVEITKWIIAVYLIFGAPHYVRWQMRTLAVKERNQTNGVEENEQK